MALRGIYSRGSMLQRRSFASKASKPSVTVRLTQTIDDMFTDELNVVPILPQLHTANRKDTTTRRLHLSARVLDVGEARDG